MHRTAARHEPRCFRDAGMPLRHATSRKAVPQAEYTSIHCYVLGLAGTRLPRRWHITSGPARGFYANTVDEVDARRHRMASRMLFGLLTAAASVAAQSSGMIHRYLSLNLELLTESSENCYGRGLSIVRCSSWIPHHA